MKKPVTETKSRNKGNDDILYCLHIMFSNNILLKSDYLSNILTQSRITILWSLLL